MTDDLEPCPFCNGKVYYERDERFYRIVHPVNDCPCIIEGVRTQASYETLEELTEAWNRRGTQ